MTKIKTTAALVCALSLVGLPALTSAAFAQEPMKGGEPMGNGAAGGSMGKGDMDQGSMGKKSMGKKSMSKKSMMMKKHKKAM